MKNLMSFLLILLFFGLFPVYAYAEVMEGFGLINDVLISDDADTLYFFEQKLMSQTWMPDTKIMQKTGTDITAISEDLFTYPTELNSIERYLIFATISDECLGEVMCNYQDIIMMSKDDGDYKKIIYNMKSAVHISTYNNELYLSESSGSIWKFSMDGSNRQLLYKGNNIITDIAISDGNIYWIEETSDQNSMIVALKEDKIETVAENLQVPYSLSSNIDKILWNEIRVDSKENRVTEFTKFSVYDGDEVRTVAEFNNKTPISTFAIPVYEPYLFLEDFLFVTNNTATDSTIHLIDLKSNLNFPLKTIDDYEVMYFRNSPDSLYIVGQNEKGFLIEKISLPVTVPEFSSILIMITIIAGLSLTVVSRRSFHY